MRARVALNLAAADVRFLLDMDHGPAWAGKPLQTLVLAATGSCC